MEKGSETRTHCSHSSEQQNGPARTFARAVCVQTELLIKNQLIATGILFDTFGSPRIRCWYTETNYLVSAGSNVGRRCRFLLPQAYAYSCCISNRWQHCYQKQTLLTAVNESTAPRFVSFFQTCCVRRILHPCVLVMDACITSLCGQTLTKLRLNLK